MAKTTLNKKEAVWVLDRLKEAYPNPKPALEYKNNWQLLIAVVLSAQTTDVSVNKVTGLLFERYPTPDTLAGASQEDVESIIKTIGMYRTKSKNIINLARMLIEDYDGQVPDDFDELVKLPGVGRKTANVVLSVGFDEQRIAVDTHVFRVSNRIGLCHEDNVLKTELKLQRILPKDRWSEAHHCLIWHGRKVCHARKADCDNCVVKEKCLYVKSK